MEKRDAKEECCVRCGEKAVIFWPIIDGYIEALAYCNNCLKIEQDKLLKALKEVNNEK